jgi:hypothetical protein
MGGEASPAWPATGPGGDHRLQGAQAPPSCIWHLSYDTRAIASAHLPQRASGGPAAFVGVYHGVGWGLGGGRWGWFQCPSAVRGLASAGATRNLIAKRWRKGEGTGGRGGWGRGEKRTGSGRREAAWRACGVSGTRHIGQMRSTCHDTRRPGAGTVVSVPPGQGSRQLSVRRLAGAGPGPRYALARPQRLQPRRWARAAAGAGKAHAQDRMSGPVVAAIPLPSWSDGER